MSKKYLIVTRDNYFEAEILSELIKHKKEKIDRYTIGANPPSLRNVSIVLTDESIIKIISPNKREIFRGQHFGGEIFIGQRFDEIFIDAQTCSIDDILKILSEPTVNPDSTVLIGSSNNGCNFQPISSIFSRDQLKEEKKIK